MLHIYANNQIQSTPSRKMKESQQKVNTQLSDNRHICLL